MANKHVPEQTVLTNLVMVENPETKEVLLENRRNKNWAGITFPGGHVEPGESFVEAAIREVYEETQLQIENPQLVGIKQFMLNSQTRYIVLLFRTNKYKGTPQASLEGDVYWADPYQVKQTQAVDDFFDILQIFKSYDVSELYYQDYHGQSIKRVE
ncbi:8-oxo-dGTP diphosphatase [Pediococcus siamensis]|uniref:8-oxo-dGTP diphosphatase n=1 Tax=Pediococcus siamensis TaxID=381829 RepID=UPI0039A0E977